MTKLAIFLDRDGVINENVNSGYVSSIHYLKFIEGSLEAIARLSKLDAKIFIVTNQAAIGRGLMTSARLTSINSNILANVEASGGRIDGVYVCPHTPEYGCPCRKPFGGLGKQAIKDHNIKESTRKIVIGDHPSDLQMGISMGADDLMLVKSGRYADAIREMPMYVRMIGYSEYNNLAEAVDNIVETQESNP